MSENIQEQSKTRITRISLGRVYNLGNYENLRVELAIDVAEGDDAASVFKNASAILANLHAKSGVDSYDKARARRILAIPEAALDEDDRKRLPWAKEITEKFEAAKARRLAARAALSTLEFSSQYKDHKLDWEDEDDYGDY